ncbi:unnamed protein product [Notodromas monacha]|uniref:EGF-like domain-containing protein n=1 Tax=Notodromas monacha TaxID=399045 RepID=A0A7R9BCW3_9CRUS|nr:unnamed protein product [Notodromas monacha]CAG0912209.1 unnamed protein product [Notodromas monacha]
MHAGLTLDHILRRVYWADAHKGTIEYANWNGNGMAVELKLQKIQIPYSVAVFEASVIWNDLSSSAVLQADRRFRNSTKVLRKKVLPIDIRVRHAAAQQEYPGLDPCSDVQTKNCSHICVLMPNGYVCLCPDGLTRVSDHECQFASRLLRSVHSTAHALFLNEKRRFPRCLKNYHGPRCAFESTDRETYWRETQGGGDGHVTLDAGGSGGIIAAVILCFILVGLMIVGIYHVRRSEANRLAASLAANRLLRSVQFWSGKDFRLLAHDVLQEAAGASEDEAVHMPANPAECVAPSAMTNNRKRVDGTERVGVNFDNAMSLSPAKPSEFTNQVFGLRQDTRGRGSDGNL